MDAVIPLKVAAEPTRQLLAALAADTTSRVSSDREARAVALCAEQVATASEVSIDADTLADGIAQAETRWSAARETCGERWQSTHEQQYMAFRAQLAATAARRARNSAPAARSLATLSDAERSIVTDLFGGKCIPAIALERGTSPRTVAHQIGNVYRKLGASSRRELLALLA